MEIDNLINDFKSLFEETNSINLTLETRFKELDEWDSLTFLSLLVLIENKYSLSVTPNELHQCQTIEDLFNLIQKSN